MAGSLKGALPLLSALIELISGSRKDLVFVSVFPLALPGPKELESHATSAPGSAKALLVLELLKHTLASLCNVSLLAKYIAEKRSTNCICQLSLFRSLKQL